MSTSYADSELKKQIDLALPLCLGYLGQQLMGVVDTAMLGRWSEAALAASGIANGLLFAVTVIGMGAVMGLDSLVPQALGAGESERAHRLFRAGVRLALLLAAPLTLAVAMTPLLLPLFAVHGEVSDEALTYILSRLPSVLPFLIFTAQRSYLQARGVTRPLVVAVVFANLVNVLADQLLIFGDAGLERLGLPPLGLPALGVAGAGIATSIVTCISAAILAFGLRGLAPVGAGREPGLVRPIFRMGLPIGLHFGAEVGIFALTGLLAGRLGKLPAAAHQIALTIASFSFSFAMGVGAATSVRVGRQVGAASHRGARRAGLTGLGLAAALMGTSGLLFLVLPDWFARIFTDDAAVVAAARPLIRIAAFFQLSDAIQAVSGGALRGAGDTRSPFLGNVIGHYAIGLPVALALAFYADLGAAGLWWGLSVGLTAVAIALTLRFLWLSSKPIERAE